MIDIGMYKQLMVWHLPAIGVLFWEFRFLLILIFDIHGAANIISLILGVFTFFGFAIFIRSKRVMPRFAIAPIIALVIVFFITALIVKERPVGLLLNWLTTWFFTIVPFVSAGYIASKKLGENASLLVVACVPLWLEMYLVPGAIGNEIWDNIAVPHIKLSLLAFHWIPPLAYFILIPSVSLIFTGYRKKIWWLISSTLIVTSGLVLIFILNLHSGNYILDNFWMWLHFTTALWTPVVLTLILCFRLGIMDAENKN